MKRKLLLVLAGILTLALIALAALGVLLAVVNPNDYKKDISAAVFKATGRQLILQGDLSVAFFPWLGLNTGAFQILDPPVFGAEPLLAARSASLRLALAPLLRGKVEIQEILLEGLRLKLAETAAGHKNWEPGQGESSPSAPEKDVTPLQEGAPPKAESSLALHIEAVRLTDGEVVYRNLARGDSLRLGLKSMEVFNVGLNEDMILTVQGEVEDVNAGLKTAFDLRGTVRAGADGSAGAVVDALTATASRGDVSLRASLAGDASFSSGSLCAAFTGKLEETTLKGRLELSLPDSRRPGLGISGELTVGSLDVDALLAKAARLAPEPRAPEGAAAPGRDTAAATPRRQDKKEQELPAALRALDADLRLSANTLVIAGMPLTTLAVQVTSDKGQARIPYSLKLFKGSISGVAEADLRPPLPNLSLRNDIKDLEAGDLLAAATGKRTLSGRLAGAQALSARGLDPGALKSSLSGTAEIRLHKGEVQGFSLVPEDFQQLGLAPLPVNLPLERLVLLLSLKQGLAEVKQGLLESPLLTAEMSGTANLVSEVLALKVRLRLGGAPPDIPLLVGGTFSNPACGVDMAAFLQNSVSDLLNSPEKAAKTLNKGGSLLRDVKKLLPGR
ncbi:MAG: AsmA family protein [Desulfovibrio sp.]|jgi:AsmA protein|nr:AsmA family protein [Desulfovibrio sp.]